MTGLEIAGVATAVIANLVILGGLVVGRFPAVQGIIGLLVADACLLSYLI